MTPYSRLFASLLSKLKSYDIADMTEQEVVDQLSDYITPAIARFHICKKDLNDRDEEQGCFNEDLTDKEIEILANFMLLAYYDAEYVMTPTLLKVSLSQKDFNAYSPANMLDKLNDKHTQIRKDNETLVSQYSILDGLNTESALFKKRYTKRDFGW